MKPRLWFEGDTWWCSADKYTGPNCYGRTPLLAYATWMMVTALNSQGNK